MIQPAACVGYGTLFPYLNAQLINLTASAIIFSWLYIVLQYYMHYHVISCYIILCIHIIVRVCAVACLLSLCYLTVLQWQCYLLVLQWQCYLFKLFVVNCVMWFLCCCLSLVTACHLNSQCGDHICHIPESSNTTTSHSLRPSLFIN